ncbi:hypothetical protein STEG23_006452 [Scotinomys teguina]
MRSMANYDYEMAQGSPLVLVTAPNDRSAPLSNPCLNPALFQHYDSRKEFVDEEDKVGPPFAAFLSSIRCASASQSSLVH